MKAFRFGTQACILATWFLISLTPVQAAVVVLPDAAYQAELNYPPPPRRLVTPGGIGVDEDWLTGSGTRRGHVTASAGTVGGLMPRAEISIDLTGTGFAANTADAHATLTYYWMVEQVGGPPRSRAQVRIRVQGAASSALDGDAQSNQYAVASLHFIGSTSNFVAGPHPLLPSMGDSFDRTFTRLLAKDSVYSTSLIAHGIANAGWHDAPGTARLDAFADPLIEIDPAWAFAGDFRVVFSNGIGAAPIPEPAAYVLWSTGLLLLLAARAASGARGA